MFLTAIQLQAITTAVQFVCVLAAGELISILASRSGLFGWVQIRFFSLSDVVRVVLRKGGEHKPRGILGAFFLMTAMSLLSLLLMTSTTPEHVLSGTNVVVGVNSLQFTSGVFMGTDELMEQKRYTLINQVCSSDAACRSQSSFLLDLYEESSVFNPTPALIDFQPALDLGSGIRISLSSHLKDINMNNKTRYDANAGRYLVNYTSVDYKTLAGKDMEGADSSIYAPDLVDDIYSRVGFDMVAQTLPVSGGSLATTTANSIIVSEDGKQFGITVNVHSMRGSNTFEDSTMVSTVYKRFTSLVTGRGITGEWIDQDWFNSGKINGRLVYGRERDFLWHVDCLTGQFFFNNSTRVKMSAADFNSSGHA